MLLGKSGAVERDQETINCTVYCLQTQRQHRRTSLDWYYVSTSEQGLEDG